MRLERYPDRDLMMLKLADTLTSELAKCLTLHPWASLAVPGGTTPGPIFDSLCDAPLDWARIHVMLSDERWVPESSERSNTRLLKERLLTGRASEARYIPLVTEDATPEEGIPKLLPALAEEMPISVLLLGMGADMHTASIFPGADNLEAALAPDAPALIAMRAPGATEPRVTLPAAVLAAAMSIHVVITGEDKLVALERARALPPKEAPIAVVLKSAIVHWAK
ncbi:MAG: 6-phosphogluconolactonase [Pseudomonadota bacterium]